MCTRFSIGNLVLKPGTLVDCWLDGRPQRFVWAGFATTEKMHYWTKQRGGILLDVPAERFAERSQRDARLIWGDVPAQHVIRGLLDPNEGRPLLKIVTRASHADELEQYEHPRMPVIEAPLYSATLIEPTPEPPSPQGELF